MIFTKRIVGRTTASAIASASGASFFQRPLLAPYDACEKLPAPAVDVKTLHAKIGQLTLEKDFLEGALSKAGLLSVKR